MTLIRPHRLLLKLTTSLSRVTSFIAKRRHSKFLGGCARCPPSFLLSLSHTSPLPSCSATASPLSGQQLHVVRPLFLSLSHSLSSLASSTTSGASTRPAGTLSLTIHTFMQCTLWLASSPIGVGAVAATPPHISSIFILLLASYLL
jgi:hypothetical protein